MQYRPPSTVPGDYSRDRRALESPWHAPSPLSHKCRSETHLLIWLLPGGEGVHDGRDDQGLAGPIDLRISTGLQAAPGNGRRPREASWVW